MLACQIKASFAIPRLNYLEPGMLQDEREDRQAIVIWIDQENCGHVHEAAVGTEGTDGEKSRGA